MAGSYGSTDMAHGLTTLRVELSYFHRGGQLPSVRRGMDDFQSQSTALRGRGPRWCLAVYAKHFISSGGHRSNYQTHSLTFADRRWEGIGLIGDDAVKISAGQSFRG